MSSKSKGETNGNHHHYNVTLFETKTKAITDAMVTTSIRFVRPDHADIPPNNVLSYIQENLASIQSIHCSETLDTDHVQSLCRILIENPALTNVTSLALPNNNALTTSNAVQAISRLLQVNTTIVNLNVSYNTMLDVHMLLQPLISTNTTLTSLNLTHTNANKHVSSIASMLNQCSTMEELFLGHNQLGPRGIRILASKFNHLRVLHLSHNQLGSRGMHLLLMELASSKCLEELDVSCNRASTKGTRALCQWLMNTNHSSSLTTVKFNSNQVGIMGAFAISTALQYNHTLLQLELGGNQIGDAGAVALSHGLQGNTTLQTLKCDWNQIQDEGAQALAKALMHNTCLVSLDLSGNSIANEGGIVLAQSLPYNLVLRELHLSRNQLHNTAAQAMYQALVGVNTTLEDMTLEENPISKHYTIKIQHAFRYRDNLKSWLKAWLEHHKNDSILNLSRRASIVGDEEVLYIAQHLTTSPSLLRSLHLRGSLITHKSIAILCQDYLSHSSCRLERLYISHTNIANDGVEAICNALQENKHLIVLSLSFCNITPVGAKTLGSMNPATLQRLVLDGNDIGNEGFEALALMNGNNTSSSLQSLSVANNGISDATSIAASRHWKEVHLRGNVISDRGALDLARAFMDVEEDGLLERLSLVDNQITQRGGEALARFLPPSTNLDY